MHVGMLINDAVKCSQHFVSCVGSNVHKLIQHGSMLFDGLFKYSLTAKWLRSQCGGGGGGSFECTICVFNVQFYFGEIEVFFF